MAAPGAIEVTTLDDPTPGPGDVVVEVAAVGLCGTDLHILAGEHGALPVVPGHEVTGSVVAAGAESGEIRVGDRVAIDPSLPCRACRFCRRGQENLCLTLGALGVTTAGGAAEYMRADASRCIVLPDHVDLHGATLIEPLSCVLRGYDVLRTALGASVLIYGAGTMGLLLLEVAKHTGPRSVHVVDPNTERATRAAALGCTGSAPSVAALDVDEKWDVVIDATGNADAIQDGVERVDTRRHVSAVRRGLTRDSSVDLSVRDLQPRDHDHRFDGGAAQLRTRRGSVRCGHRGLADICHQSTAARRIRRCARVVRTRRGREDAGPPGRVAARSPAGEGQRLELVDDASTRVLSLDRARVLLGRGSERRFVDDSLDGVPDDRGGPSGESRRPAPRRPILAAFEGWSPRTGRQTIGRPPRGSC